jgi:hypothetical protein
MLVAIHQPHYVPWLGYLDRMVKADVFIILDHVIWPVDDSILLIVRSP